MGKPRGVTTGSRPPGPGRVLVASILVSLSASCGSTVGDVCQLEGGTGQAAVLYEQGDPTCSGDICLSLDGSSPYCTIPCAEGGDCPDGFSCVTVNLSPSTGVENNADLCVDDTPILPGDDDDSIPAGCLEGIWGTAPTLSDLTIEADGSSGVCSMKLSLTWHDEDGDLNGADSVIYFDDIQFQGVFEVADTTDSRLELTVPVEGALSTQTPYDVRVKIRDRGCNWSNELSAPDTVTPDSSCS